MIRFKQLPIGDEEKTAAQAVIDAGSLSMGPFVNGFESAFAEFIGAKHAVAVNSCTSALFLSLLCENRIRYDLPWASTEGKIELPSMTVAVVANAIIQASGKLKFIDDVSWVGKDYQLKPFDVWDSAHLVKPNQYKKYKNPQALVNFSFYPTKTICGIEGGMIATDDDESACWLRKARWYGRDMGESKVRNSWEYTVEFPGWKMNMTDMQAAIAHCGLNKFYRNDARLKEIVEQYNCAFGLKNDSMYLYRINVPERDSFMLWMKDKGVECGVHFWPLHWQPAYQDIPRETMEKTDEEAMSTVSLPLHPFLSEKDINHIIGLVNDWKETHI